MISLLAAACISQRFASLKQPAHAASSTILISEADADTPLTGSESPNEWFELRNVSPSPITLSGWTVTDNTSTETIPTVTLGPGGHVIIAGTAAGFNSEHAGFNGTVLGMSDGTIGNGLANGGDKLLLKDHNGVGIDCLSWGTDITCLNPSAGVDNSSNTNQRTSNSDTDTASDWTRAAETPDGKTAPTPASPPPVAGSFIISEFRFRGPAPGGSDNEFVEFYNHTGSDITVTTADGSAGWALVASDGLARFVIPVGTVVPARGHFLAVNSAGYGLSDYRAGNATTAAGDPVLLPGGVTLVNGYTTGIPDNGGIALFNTADSSSFTADARLDAAGYAGVNELFREGAGFHAGGVETTSNLEYSFYRDLCGFVAGVGCTTGGLPKDTNTNASDFLFVDTAATAGAGPSVRLGAPGPQNLTSPLNRNSTFAVPLLDQTKASTAAPNRVRKQCSAPSEECNPQRSALGTLSIRRRFVNNTGGAVTRLRFRVMDTTTFPLPSPNTRALADVRAITSGQVPNVAVNDSATCLATAVPSVAAPCTVTVEGTALEEPPVQALGGGYNATLTAGTITLATPLAAGASVNIQFLLGVQASGNFRFLVNIEALSGTGP